LKERKYKMKNIWKWILGILAVLVVLALLAGAAFFFRNRMMAGGFGPGYAFRQQQQQPNGNVQPNAPNFGRYGNGYSDGLRGPMMGGRGFHHFGGGFMFIGGFFQLVVFGLLLYGAYWLGRRNARIALDPKPAAPIEAPKSE
jgi:uncharacterized membrane protein